MGLINLNQYHNNKWRISKIDNKIQTKVAKEEINLNHVVVVRKQKRLEICVFFDNGDKADENVNI